MLKRFAFKSNKKKQGNDKSRVKSVSIKPPKSKEDTSKYILTDYIMTPIFKWHNSNISNHTKLCKFIQRMKLKI